MSTAHPPQDQRPAATVVIPARNAIGTIEAQLAALTGQIDAPRFEVVVVDDGSRDGTPEAVGGWAERLELRVVGTGRPDGSGVAAARNLGAQHAAAPLILFCDADDVVGPGWVAAMVAGLASADLVGGRLEVDRLNSPEAIARVPAPPQDALPMCMRFRPYAIGATIGVRSELIDRLDGFDTSFVGGHEEVDFAWRAAAAGARLAFAGEAIVHYRYRGDLSGAMRQRFGYGRSYAQLYSRWRAEPVPRLSGRHEVKVQAQYLLEGLRRLRSPRTSRQEWLVGAAWTVGRLYGDLRYRCRSPL